MGKWRGVSRRILSLIYRRRGGKLRGRKGGSQDGGDLDRLCFEVEVLGARTLKGSWALNMGEECLVGRHHREVPG